MSFLPNPLMPVVSRTTGLPFATKLSQALQPPPPVPASVVSPSILNVGSPADRLNQIRSFGQRFTQQSLANTARAPLEPVGPRFRSQQETNRINRASTQPFDGPITSAILAAGFSREELPMAMAIMRAESGGNAKAVNNRNTNGSTDTGLFQINSIHSGWTNGMDLFDPAQNAKAAYKIYSDAGKRWTPWSAYNNGSYKKFYNSAISQEVTVPQSVSFASNGTVRQSAVNKATQVIGLPYVWGGNSLASGVDCSGLVQQVYSQLGMKLPRVSHDQSLVGTRTSISALKPGDLVAWQGGWRGPNYVGHIAIYAGNGQIIEAPSAGKTVRRRALKAGEQAFGVALKFPGE